jgi:hypothetical protein
MARQPVYLVDYAMFSECANFWRDATSATSQPYSAQLVSVDNLYITSKATSDTVI